MEEGRGEVMKGKGGEDKEKEGEQGKKGYIVKKWQKKSLVQCLSYIHCQDHAVCHEFKSRLIQLLFFTEKGSCL